MQKLKIQGGYPLNGELRISGAKNAALPILCCSLLTNDALLLSNIPDLQDVRTIKKLLNQMGVSIQEEGEGIAILTGNNIHSLVAPYDLVKTMRASILVLGPTLSRFGEAEVSLPGGCAIGSRPVDLHIKGLTAMGAKISIENGYIKAKVKGKLKGTHIVMDTVSVTGTENLMMAASLAEGKTTIENAAREPEIEDLANCLNRMGAKISGIGTDTLCIEGVEKLHGTDHQVIPDRIEAGTFLVASALTRGDVCLLNANPSHCGSIIEKLKEAGIDTKFDKKYIWIDNHKRAKAVNFHTRPYPGFPTDMQAQFMVLNSVAEGTGVIVETIFENRFMHTLELARMGANIETTGNTAVTHGVKKLSGTTVMATDLRASASLLIAGLIAEGETVIDRIYHLDRGYEDVEEKLSQIGAKVERIK